MTNKNTGIANFPIQKPGKYTLRISNSSETIKKEVVIKPGTNYTEVRFKAID